MGSPVAYFAPGPWEVVILGGCCLVAVLAAVGIGVAIYFATRRRPPAPPAGGAAPPSGDAAPPAA